MKKIVITFGLLSGAIAGGLMLVTIPFARHASYETLTALGYTTFVAAFLMVFFGIRSYRDNVGGGAITFGRGFRVGILITLIACGIYVISWEIISHRFYPTFFEDFTNDMVEKMRAAGATPEAVNQQIQENEKYKEWFKNPLIRYAMTMMEAFPVGLVMTLVSAAMLKKKTASRT